MIDEQKPSVAHGDGIESYLVEPGSSLAGEITVPGDKSISHRSLMFGAIADGITEIDGLLASEDCLATAAALTAMGAKTKGAERRSRSQS